MLDTLSASLWNATTNEVVAGQLPCTITSLTESSTTWDEATIAIPVDQEIMPGSWAHTLALTSQAGDIVFHGPIVDVAWTEGQPTIMARAESWRGYVHGIPHGRGKSYVDIDPAVVIRDLWAEALSYSDSPKQVTYAATTSTFAVGQAGEDDKADPLNTAWYLGTDLGQVVADLSAQFGFTHFETHRWDNDAPSTTVTTMVDAPVPVRDAVFASGVNVLSAIEYRQERKTTFSSVLSLGSGEGPSRLAGDAAANRGILRRAHLDTSGSAELTKTQLQQRASALLAAQDTVLPFDTLHVATDHPYGALGTWGLGDVVTVQSAGEQTWQVLITAVEWKPDGTAVLSLEGV